MAKMELDMLDRRILELLQEDGRRLNTELADATGLTPAPCLRRVKRLEQHGVIQAYEARLDASKLGIDLAVFVTIRLDKQGTEQFEAFTELMSTRLEVQECHLLLGEGDFLLKVRIRNLAAYQRFLLEHITGTPGVRSMHSAIAIQTAKESARLVVR